VKSGIGKSESIGFDFHSTGYFAVRKPFTHVQLEVPRFGEFARQRAQISSDDIAACLSLQRQSGERLGRILVREGYLAPEQVIEILKDQARWAATMRSRDVAPQQFPLSTSFSLCLPCYNEAEVIEEVLRGASAVLPEFLDEFEIIVVDDGSTDATPNVVARLMQNEDRIRLIRHEVNRGYGAAVSTALRAALGHWICFTDGDGQFNLLDLPQLLVGAQEVDVVVGYRYRRAEGRMRRLNAHSWNRLIRHLLGVRVRDLDCAFKLFPRWVVENLKLTANGACVSAEILAQCVHGGLAVREVPVSHFSRAAGKATGANLKVVAQAFRELPLVWRYRSHTPLIRPVREPARGTVKGERARAAESHFPTTEFQWDGEKMAKAPAPVEGVV
jgi:Glycosyl transferase family 2